MGTELEETKYIVRPSSLADFADCHRRAAASVFADDFKEFGFEVREMLPNISAAVGDGVHKGIKLLNEQKRDQKTPSMPDAIAKAMNAYDEKVADGVTTDDITPDRYTAHRQVQSIIRMYGIRILPTVAPKFVEQKVSFSLGDEYYLEGTPDLYTWSDDLIDLKTGRIKNHLLQFGSYGLGYQAQQEQPKRAISINIARTGLTAKAGQAAPKIDPYDIEKATNAAYAMAHKFKQEHRHFLQTKNEWAFAFNPDSNLCKEKYCRLWGTASCTGWKK